MFSLSGLDDREIELIVMALRYWRSQRPPGATRRTDPPVTAETIDLLLAKLGSRPRLSSPPSDPPSDQFADLPTS